MILPIAELKRLRSAGAGLRLSAGHFSTEDLRDLAASGAQLPHRPQLILMECGRLSADDIASIASAGAGTVVFEME